MLKKMIGLVRNLEDFEVLLLVTILQGPTMLPTTITSEMTKLKEKVRVLEVRLVLYVVAFCRLPNFVTEAISLHAMAAIYM